MLVCPKFDFASAAVDEGKWRFFTEPQPEGRIFVYNTILPLGKMYYLFSGWGPFTYTLQELSGHHLDPISKQEALKIAGLEEFPALEGFYEP